MNNTKLATTKLRLQHWAQIFHDRANSGMNVKEYCAAQCLSKDAYYYWLRKVKNAALESAGIDFVELDKSSYDTSRCDPQNTEPCFTAEAIVSIGGVNISVNSTTSKALITSILEAVKNAE